MSGEAKRRVMFVLAEFPGYATPLFAEMGRCLARHGVPAVYLCASPHYEAFRTTKLSDVAPTYYVSDCLSSREPVRTLPGDFDRWWLHATFVRQREHVGRHLNDWSRYARAWHCVDDVFERHRDIGAVCSEFPTNSTISLAFAHAKRRGIDFFGYMSARVPKHFNVSHDEFGVEYVENPSPPSVDPSWSQAPDYMRLPMNNMARERWSTLLRPIVRSLPRLRWQPGERSLEIGAPVVFQAQTTLNRLTNKLRHAYATRLGLFEHPVLDASKTNLLFPLQFRPEASTLVQARYWNDDYETLRNIAFSLPVDARLYVKEHPSAVGVRDRKFYMRIKELPAVHLVAPEWPLLANLRRFNAVVCLTSTVGFEAIQVGVPVLLIGRTFYEDYPGVTRVRDWEQLTSALRAVKPLLEPRSRREEILQRYARTCFPGNFAYMSESSLDADNVERLVRPLLAKLHHEPVRVAG